MVAPVHIRWFIARDLPEALAIEATSFAQPWTEQDFRDTFRQRQCVGMVTEVGKFVTGYFVYELHKHKLHLLNMAVAPIWRGQGIAAQMIFKLKSKLSIHLRTHITADIRETNLTAQLFFRGQGFRAAAILRGFHANGEDAYRMRYSLEPAAMEPSDVIVRDYGGS